MSTEIQQGSEKSHMMRNVAAAAARQNSVQSFLLSVPHMPQNMHIFLNKRERHCSFGIEGGFRRRKDSEPLQCNQ